MITMVAMGRSNGTIRADEDELCALYLRACLEGRQPEIINSSGPRDCRFVEALPKNNYGKVLKTGLRRLLADVEPG